VSKFPQLSNSSSGKVYMRCVCVCVCVCVCRKNNRPDNNKDYRPRS